MDSNIDGDNALKLLALFIALSAYVSNVRRDMQKTCTSLRDNDYPDIQRIEKKEKEIVWLVLADIPLIVATLSTLYYLWPVWLNTSRPFLIDFAIGSFGIAVICLAAQHIWQWIKSFASLSNWRHENKWHFILAVSVLLILLTLLFYYSYEKNQEVIIEKSAKIEVALEDLKVLVKETNASSKKTSEIAIQTLSLVQGLSHKTTKPPKNQKSGSRNRTKHTSR